MQLIGKGAREIRIRDNGQYRIIYMATLGETVIVLHAFQKQSQKTRRRDIRQAQRALKDAQKRKV